MSFTREELIEIAHKADVIGEIVRQGCKAYAVCWTGDRALTPAETSLWKPRGHPKTPDFDIVLFMVGFGKVAEARYATLVADGHHLHHPVPYSLHSDLLAIKF